MLQNNNAKKQGMGCGAGILGTVLVILGVVLHAVISSLICRVIIHARFGDEVACAILTFTVTNIIVAFILYEVIFVTWQIRASQRATDKNFAAPSSPKKLDKVVALVFVCCIAASLLFSVVNANTYTCLKEDSISEVCFVTKKEYRWDTRSDVQSYSFSCDVDGAMTFKVKMKDGKVFELLGGSTSHSEAFGKKYETDKLSLLKYVADLSDSFDGNEKFIIEKKIIDSTEENAKKVYGDKAENTAIWAEIKRIIE